MSRITAQAQRWLDRRKTTTLDEREAFLAGVDAVGVENTEWDSLQALFAQAAPVDHRLRPAQLGGE